MKYLLLAGLLLMLSIQHDASAAQTNQVAEIAPSLIDGAEVDWGEEVLLPGQKVKARVRGEALSRINLAKGSWVLVAGESPVKAVIVWPGRADEQAPFALDIVNRSTGRADLEAVFDRGAEPLPFNMLTIKLASQSIIAPVTIDMGLDPGSLQPAGPDQLIYQVIEDGKLIRSTDVNCDPGDNRYIKITLKGAGSATLTGVDAFFSSTFGREVYQVVGALGSMVEQSTPGDHLWPILLEHTNLPLAKIKLIGGNAGDTRNVSAVVLNQEGRVEQTIARATWVNGIAKAGLLLDDRWIDLPGEALSGQLGVVVEDGNLEPLQLSQVQAYAREVWLVFEMPENPNLVLLFDELDGQQQYRISIDGAISCGEFSAVKAKLPPLSQMLPHEQEAPVRGTWAYTSALKLWFYGLGAVVCLVAGLLILRSRKAEYGS